jgi:sec-independent protein translocase protein TatA
MFGLGTGELILILIIVLIIFGAGKLPEIGTAIGKGIKNFKKATHEPLDDSSTAKPQNQNDQTDKK